jgi:sterol desaturase/sphingolipid hydroxylase (fatty acid hydroxylase superfamily)
MREYINQVGVVFLLTVIFYPIELILPAEKGQPLAKRLLNLAYVPLFLALAFFVVAPVANLVATKILIVSGNGLLPQFGNRSSFVLQFLLAISFAVFSDFWQYWLHRLQHTLPSLWETHKFHHSDTALNATTQTRHHILHLALSTIFYLPVLVVFSTQYPHYIALFMMFQLWGFVNHANIRVDIGPLTPIVSGPQWHRIHHSVLKEHQDRNFATFFPFIDKLFGTYHRPARNEYPPTGLQGKQKSSPVREATIMPFVAWYRRSLTWSRKVVRTCPQTEAACRNAWRSDSADS